MIYPSNFEDKIGFNEIRNLIRQKCVNKDTPAFVDKMTFSNHFPLIDRLLRETDEFKRALSQFDNSLKIPLDNLPEQSFEGVRSKLTSEGGHITAEEAVALRGLLKVSEEVYVFFHSDEFTEKDFPYPALRHRVRELQSVEFPIRLIDRVLDKDGNIKPGASPVLDEIRSHIRGLQGSMGNIVRRILESAIKEGYTETSASAVIREGRLVIPVNAMNKRSVPGIVHGESSTGRTVFIEPGEVVAANNRLRELENEERREIIKILTELTNGLREFKDIIDNSVSLMLRLDFTRAKALFAIDVDGQLPSLSKGPELEWYHAVHPLLLRTLREHGKEVVPLNIGLGTDRRILIISGPNAGGKSVCLKTVGIVQYMMQCGVLPPVYSNSHMGIFDNVFIDIGDEQSMENDLSTYSSHIRNMKFFVEHGDKKTLFLIDEFGAGTEPLIGGAIAEAVLETLNKEHCWGVVTTHYQNLKLMAEHTPGLINGSMLYDRHLMQPLFTLSIGNPGSSFALEIAKKTGLPSSIIKKATEIVGQEYVDSDKYLLDINRDKKYWEKKRYDIKVKEKKLDEIIEKWENAAAEIKTQRKTLIDEARKKASELIKDANRNIEKTIKEIKEANAENQRTRVSRRELEEFKNKIEQEYIERQALFKYKPAAKRKKKIQEDVTRSKTTPVQLSPGDYAKLDNKGDAGEVISVNGGKATVNFGFSKLTVDTSRLVKVDKKPSGTIRINSVITRETTEQQRNRQLNFSSEIDVRGMRVDEALQAVTYFIDDAVQYNVSPLRILHGTGTGALRQSIRDYLKSLGKEITFADEDVRMGGAGITVVNIR